MRIILILFVVTLSFADRSFAQSKTELEQKAQKYIDDCLLYAAERCYFDLNYWVQPEEWRWKGYDEPIYADSLICTNRQVKRWMKELLNPYDTLTLIERERQFPAIRVDRLDGKIILCKFCIKSTEGIDAFYNWVVGNTNDGRGDASPYFSYTEGYWWVDGKLVMVLGNAVDLFFKRHKNQRIGDPLPPHTTIDDMEQSFPDYVDNRYWVYENGELKKCHFLYENEVKEGEYTYNTTMSYNEFYFEKIRESFNANGL